MKKKLIGIINNFFGIDAAYFNVDAPALAKHLIENNVYYVAHPENTITVKDKNFSFEYGIVTYQHRFSINRSLNDYEETTLNKCIRIGVELKYKTMAKDKLVYELQIVYKDENNKLQCACLDLEEYHVIIKHKGNMMLTL